MKSAQPVQYLWWLVSRASGIVALVLISVTFVFGLVMAAGALRGSTRKRAVMRLHEHLALTALAAIAVHGLSLLGDHWLRPGWRGITIPFSLAYRPQFTAAGIVAGYLVLLLGPSFYLRRRIGARRWRRLHRATVIVWLLGVVHTIGAGTDGGTVWLRAIVLAPVPVIVYLMIVRILAYPRFHADRRRSTAPHRSRPAHARSRVRPMPTEP